MTKKEIQDLTDAINSLRDEIFQLRLQLMNNIQTPITVYPYTSENVLPYSGGYEVPKTTG